MLIWLTLWSEWFQPLKCQYMTSFRALENIDFLTFYEPLIAIMMDRFIDNENHTASCFSYTIMKAAIIAGGCEGEKERERQTSHAPNCLYRGYFFISSTYENNQQQAHKAAHLFLHPICSVVEPSQNIIHLISPWISRHDWAVLCETRHQDGLMGLEIYASTIWAALAFKLQSSGEMGNNNCIKIKKNLQLTITVRNWPRVLALTGRCCTAWSPAVIRMWEQAVPTHWAHQAVSDMIRVDNDNRKMKRWSEKSAHV